MKRSVARVKEEPRERPTNAGAVKLFHHGSPDHHSGEHDQINPLTGTTGAFRQDCLPASSLGRIGLSGDFRRASLPVRFPSKGLRSLPTGLLHPHPSSQPHGRHSFRPLTAIVGAFRHRGGRGF